MPLRLFCSVYKVVLYFEWKRYNLLLLFVIEFCVFLFTPSVKFSMGSGDYCIYPPLTFFLCSSASHSSLLFLQVDNRPCIHQQETTCFPSAPSAARFLQASRMAKHPELEAVIQVRGVMEELGDRNKIEKQPEGKQGEKTDSRLCPRLSAIH